MKQEAEAFALMKAKGVQINEVKDIREFQERAATGVDVPRGARWARSSSTGCWRRHKAAAK